jgi:hypothetical protein
MGSAVDASGDGVTFANALPGYHELHVRDGDVWHVAAFALAADAGAAIRLDGVRLVDARAEGPAPAQRIDVLARDVAGARAWQAATSALAPPLPESDTLAGLQAAFVRHALHGASAAPLCEHVVKWCDPGRALAQAADAAAVGRAVAGMLTLDPALAAALPVGDLIGALSEAGNDSLEADLLAAANALQLALSR